jgi:hypothetical protein
MTFDYLLRLASRLSEVENGSPEADRPFAGPLAGKAGCRLYPRGGGGTLAVAGWLRVDGRYPFRPPSLCRLHAERDGWGMAAPALLAVRADPAVGPLRGGAARAGGADKSENERATHRLHRRKLHIYKMTPDQVSIYDTVVLALYLPKETRGSATAPGTTEALRSAGGASATRVLRPRPGTAAPPGTAACGSSPA